MKVKEARSLGNGKWQATLVCGHEVTLDSSSPSKTQTVLCPVCEGRSVYMGCGWMRIDGKHNMLLSDVRSAWRSAVRALNYCENEGLKDTQVEVAEVVCKLSQVLEYIEAISCQTS